MGCPWEGGPQPAWAESWSLGHVGAATWRGLMNWCHKYLPCHERLSPQTSPKWHRCFPPFPIRGAHPHLVDEDNVLPCASDSLIRGHLPPTSPSPLLSSCWSSPNICTCIPAPLSIPAMSPLPSPPPLFPGAWKLTSPRSLTAQSHCPKAPRLRPWPFGGSVSGSPC